MARLRLSGHLRCSGLAGPEHGGRNPPDGVSEVTYYRWRQEFGGLRTEPVTRCDFVVQCGVCTVRSLAAAITSAAFAGFKRRQRQKP
jgi:hypothetical protein